MMCAWQELLKILPGWLRSDLEKVNSEKLCEIRLRINQPTELNFGENVRWIARNATRDDLNFVINTASRYSPWSSASLNHGYLTSLGGHRIGVCGEVVQKEGSPSGFRAVTGICIRVCRDFRGIGTEVAKRTGSVLILGPPGSGKTTLLRDALRHVAEAETVTVVDERGEIFPEHFQRGKRMDVLTGCPKPEGIDMALRTMGPRVIAVDEITSEGDCDALVRAGWCGVRLFATAHASSVSDLYKRPVYRQLNQCGLFDHILVLGRDRHWHEERKII